MCKSIKNTRWLCHATRGCIPTHPYLPTIELRPYPFTIYCDKVDVVSRACHGKREVDCSTSRVFHKTLECPKHHRKRLKSLDELWYALLSGSSLGHSSLAQGTQSSKSRSWKLDRRKSIGMLRQCEDRWRIVTATRFSVPSSERRSCLMSSFTPKCWNGRW